MAELALESRDVQARLHLEVAVGPLILEELRLPRGGQVVLLHCMSTRRWDARTASMRSRAHLTLPS